MPDEYGFLELEQHGLVREAPEDTAERVLVAVDCAQENRIVEPRLVEAAPLTINIDHHHDNTRFGDVNLVVEEASSTGEVLADIFEDLGVELTPAIAEALYTARRHRHGPVPVLEHDPEGAAARRPSSSRPART